MPRAIFGRSIVPIRVTVDDGQASTVHRLPSSIQHLQTMSKRTTTFDLATIALNATAPQPLHRQLYDGVRLAVLQRQLTPGARLPSTRDLCNALGISRNTVVSAFDQLIAEGYLESRVGDGTYVTSAVPDA